MFLLECEQEVDGSLIAESARTAWSSGLWGSSANAKLALKAEVLAPSRHR